MTIRLGILISGRGSNMQSIVRGIREGSIDAQVSLVFANRPKAPGLEWAREQGLPTASLSHRDFESREAFDRG
ncbi:MAG: formyltransferase family protein, partial [Myxococcota bacterium]|nr:formyltransferase family protein [Myxococcota bacterium]